MGSINLFIFSKIIIKNIFKTYRKFVPPFLIFSSSQPLLTLTEYNRKSLKNSTIYNLLIFVHGEMKKGWGLTLILLYYFSKVSKTFGQVSQVRSVSLVSQFSLVSPVGSGQSVFKFEPVMSVSVCDHLPFNVPSRSLKFLQEV
jgi:hypothetical protein